MSRTPNHDLSDVTDPYTPEELARMRSICEMYPDVYSNHQTLRLLNMLDARGRAVKSGLDVLFQLERANARTADVEVERDEWKTRAEWWSDMTGTLAAMVDGHFMLPSDVSDADRLRQIRDEIKSTMGYDWMTAPLTENHELADRADALQAAIDAALAIYAEAEHHPWHETAKKMARAIAPPGVEVTP